MRALTRTWRRWLAGGFLLAAACSMFNREGPDVTCDDLQQGAINACAEGIIGTCKDGAVEYRVCADDGETAAADICEAAWQVADAYRCASGDEDFNPAPSGTGGSPATGGTGGDSTGGTPTGGDAATGGTVTTGGSSATGGTPGTGGSSPAATCDTAQAWVNGETVERGELRRHGDQLFRCDSVTYTTCSTSEPGISIRPFATPWTDEWVFLEHCTAAATAACGARTIDCAGSVTGESASLGERWVSLERDTLVECVSASGCDTCWAEQGKWQPLQACPQ